MKKRDIENFQFIQFDRGEAHFVFSTAKGALNFNKGTVEGIENLKKVKTWYPVKEIGYLDQIHSDLIYNYDEEIHQGDALITNRDNIAIGVFTADCIPVLLYSPKLKVIAAVHSGWRGTLSAIVGKTVDKMGEEYNCKANDLQIYIGPHNRGCCYEVGEDVIEKFKEDLLYSELEIVKEGKLDLEKCILAQLEKRGVSIENIHTVPFCTHCNIDYELHSYRKDKNKAGRMFSFVYLEGK